MGLWSGGNPPWQIERKPSSTAWWTPTSGNRPHERKLNVLLDSYSELSAGLV